MCFVPQEMSQAAYRPAETGKGDKMTIGVLTSGGDAPGMNAALRAVVRCAVVDGMQVKGIRHGYQGILDEDIIDLDSLSVANILTTGGTMLKTARCLEFLKSEVQDKAADILKKHGIEALVVIGGDGSFRGAAELAQRGINVMGVPATIDNDLGCTDYTIGFDTAINTAMEAIDKVRDTSSSHERACVIEVMGRSAGYIALYCGIGNGVEEMLLPELYDGNEDAIAERMLATRAKGKNIYMIVSAEGVGDASGLAGRLKEKTGIDTKAIILGHIQRGGSPTCMDRVYASVMGSRAEALIRDGKRDRVVIYKNGEFGDMDILDSLMVRKTLPNDFLMMSRKLIR